MDKTPTMPTTAADSAKRDVIMIYSPRMAGYLMMRGFYLIRIEQNKKRPGKNCFAFFDTPVIKTAMSDYIDHKFTI